MIRRHAEPPRVLVAALVLGWVAASVYALIIIVRYYNLHGITP